MSCIRLLFCLYCATVAYAQQPQPTAAVPKLVRFSGSFRPTNGLAAQPVESVTLAVYRDQTGGNALWQEIQNVAVDANGHYSLLMGATQNEGMPLDLFSSGEPRWLGALFNRPGVVEQPRVLLVSVPYALKASDAETLGGRPASAYLLAGPPMGDAASSTDPITPAKSTKATAPVSSGFPNFIAKFVNTTDVGDSPIYDANGYVGISTTQPAISLDVRTGSLPQMGIAGNTDYLTFFASDIYGPAIYWDPAKDMRFGKGGVGLYNPYGFVEQMRIQSSTGYVGIGTQTPGARLEVNGSVQADGNVTITTLGSGLIFPDGTKQTTAGGGITGVTAGTDLTGGGTSGTVTLNLDTTKVPTLAAANSFTGSPNAFTGNVGIGTQTPVAKLEVNGTVQADGNVTITTLGSGLIFPDGTKQTTAGGGGITGVTAGTDLTGGGTSGTVTLNLDTTKVPTLAGVNSFTGSPNAFTGNVGIGTQTPAAKLEVSGSVQADGNVTIATVGSGLIFPDGTKQTTAGGSITGVTAGTDLTGGGTSGMVTLNLDTTKVPTLAAANSFTGSPNAFTGNVGIGTQTPAAKLEVNGSVQADGNVTIKTLGSGLIFPDGTKQATAGGGTITGVTAGTDLTGGGTSGTVTLNLDTTKVPTLAAANSFTGSTNAFTGNVGIGTQTPGSALDVAGDFNFSGSVRYQGSPVLQVSGPSNSNIALGLGALPTNTTGPYNTATGTYALQSNTTGGANTATGTYALQTNTIGTYNTASGYGALTSNADGGENTATGRSALASNTSGNFNTAIGQEALDNNITGNNNIAIGVGAAQSVFGNNSNNIHIGSFGSSGDNHTIRIGDAGTYSAFFTAGVRGVTTGNNDAIPVMIDSAGQLGTVSSSRRFKEDIEVMGAASHDLMRLRPVTYRYKQPFADGSKPIQYGLIAEEVAEVYPDLVAHSAAGQIETVKYQVLDSMLLNEVQRQQAEIRQLQERLAKLEAVLSSISGVAKVSNVQ